MEYIEVREKMQNKRSALRSAIRGKVSLLPGVVNRFYIVEDLPIPLKRANLKVNTRNVCNT